ncbi:MAG: D-alanine--D-alanine ligase [Bacillus sp. (in: Bacteria)]|nr:D-alanine--D-alanine ligase [Bacillus sp. (in: firmicutes)]MCM1425316.1 D-alanine--D-alanine ligase [Eubacterium sp.]
MKIKVGVFFGGKSVEHEVSVISGIQALKAFDKEKYEALPIYITKENEMYTGEAAGEIENYKNIPELLKKSIRIFCICEQGKLNLVQYPEKKFGSSVVDYIDVAFPVVHGANVEDGSLQGFLRHYNVPLVGCDVAPAAVSMDKYVMKAVLKDNDIPILDCVTLHVSEYRQDEESAYHKVENKVAYPVIVKPVNLGSSVGIKIAKDREELREALEYAYEFGQKVLIERAIMNLREINCAVLGDYESAQASECEEPVSSDEILSYEDKYVAGNKSGSEGMRTAKRELPANLTPELREEIRSLAVKTFRALDCNGVSRIDFMIDKDTNKVYVNEINSIPGSLAFYLWEAVGKPYAELLDDMVKLALKREREENNLLTSFESNILQNASLSGAKGVKK